MPYFAFLRLLFLERETKLLIKTILFYKPIDFYNNLYIQTASKNTLFFQSLLLILIKIMF